MKKEELQELLSKNVKEGEEVDFSLFNLDAIADGVNKFTNDVVAKKSDPEKLMPEAIEKVIGELGIDGKSLDDVKTYIKKMGGNTDEIKEENLKLSKELETIKKERDEYENKYSSLNQEYTTKTQLDMIKGLGKDGEEAEFLHWKINQGRGDKEFDEALKEYQEANPDTFRKKETTNRRTYIENENAGNSEFLDAFNKRHSND